MSLMGNQPLAVILCQCSDQPQKPQPPAFFQAFVTAEDPRSWGSPFRIPDGGASVAKTGGGVATVAQTADHLDVFWIGNDGAIWTNWWDGADPNGTWSKHAPFSITAPNAAPPGGSIAAVTQQAGHLDVFWVGSDGAIWTHWWDANAPGGAWSAHSAFRLTAPNSTPPGGGIAAVSQYAGHLDVFWTGNDGAIWTHWWDGSEPNGA
jgi:hypothetical protein